MQNRLHTAEIQIWIADLRCYDDTISIIRAVLSEDEIRRADRFHFQIDSIRFTSARAILRSILATYVNVSPASLSFNYSPSGKPSLAGDETNIQFNVSHSGDFAAYAITKDIRVGIDIEKIRSDVPCLELADRFFSKEESDTIRSCDENGRIQNFFRCWTRKEAYIKAVGEGLSLPLNQFTISICSDGTPFLHDAEHWFVRDIKINPSYAAAVVAESSDVQVRMFEFTPKNLAVLF